MASWRVAPALRTRDQADGNGAVSAEEGANMDLVTTFGISSSALAPFGVPERRPRASSQAKKGRKLGELLVAAGVITEKVLAEALAEQRRSRPKLPLGEILLRRELVPGAVLVRFLSSQCELELDQEGGFGSGLRDAIENRHVNAPTEDDAAEPASASTGRALTKSWRASDRPRRIGELLIEAGLLNGAQLDEALAEQEDSGRMLGEILVDRRYVPMITLVNLLAEQLHGRLDQADGFGTGLRTTLEEKLLDDRATAAA